MRSYRWINLIDDLKTDFGFTARESISLFAVHGLAEFGRNEEEGGVKYKWIGGTVTNSKNATFSNMYHKILNGKSYYRSWLQGYDNGFGGEGPFPGWFNNYSF